MRTFVLGALLCIAVSALGQEIPGAFRVDLTPAPGFGPFYPPLGAAGPAGDPIGGPRDLSGDVVSGIPDTLAEIDLRFLNFHYEQGAYQALVAGGSDAAPPIGTTAEYVDQQVHHLVGRDSAGAFVWIVDTDNDEDLADETAQILPWEGPLMTLDTFRDSIMNGPDQVGFVESMPSVEVTGQVFDGEQVVDVTRKAYLLPFLVIDYPSPNGPQPRAFYWLSFDGHYVGDFESGGRHYRIWLRSASQSGLVEPMRTHIRIKDVTDGDTSFSEDEIKSDPMARSLGDVVELGQFYFRLDDVDQLGRSVSLIKVADPNSGLEEGAVAPDFEATTLAGYTISLAAMKGRHVLLSFWSSRNTTRRGWLDEVYPNYRKECVEFVTVLDDDASSARRLDWFGIPWSVIADKDQDVSIQQEYGIAVHPTFVLVDPDGRIAVWEAGGTDWVKLGRESLAVLDSLRSTLGASCMNQPTTDDVMAVMDARPHWTRDTEWYVAGCSFTADDIGVVSIGPDPTDRGWPVKLSMAGTCSPTASSDHATDWRENFRLNVILYRNLGKWELIASDPFVEERLEPQR